MFCTSDENSKVRTLLEYRRGRQHPATAQLPAALVSRSRLHLAWAPFDCNECFPFPGPGLVSSSSDFATSGVVLDSAIHASSALDRSYSRLSPSCSFDIPDEQLHRYYLRVVSELRKKKLRSNACF